MAICPVCKTECREQEVCSVCGFDEVGKTFINREEAELWKETKLVPFLNYWISQSKNYTFSGSTLVKYNGSEKNVVVPSFVTVIGKSAFSRNSTLVGITLSNSLTKIEDWAFGNCENLREIVIPDSVIELGEYSFYGCDKLTLAHIGEGVVKIAACSFDKCSNLHYLYIGKNVEEIQTEDKFSSPFNDSWQLEITVNNENTHYYVEDNCFIQRENKHFLIKGNIKSVIPNYITIIGPSCFAKNKNLNGSITIPSGVVEILDEAFYECGLKQVVLPEGLRTIRNAAFGCCNIDKIVIPKSVISIGEVPFEGQKTTMFLNRSKADIEHRIKETEDKWSKCQTEDEYNAVLEGDYWDSYWDKNGRYNDELGGSEPSKVYYRNEWHYDTNNQPIPNEAKK